jgi:hypothetical protein
MSLRIICKIIRGNCKSPLKYIADKYSPTKSPTGGLAESGLKSPCGGFRGRDSAFAITSLFYKNGDF